MSENKDRLSFREAVAYTRRGYAIWREAAPEVLISAAVKEAVTALAPYLPLYFTAQLVNAIAGGGDPERVWPMLAALLASTAVMGLIRAAATCWDNTMQYSHLWPAWNRIFFDKLLTMDFCDVDDPETQTLLTQIRQNNNWASWGLNRMVEAFGMLVRGGFQILGAIALSVSLFTMPVPAGSPLAWLNSPLCLAGMAALMVLSVLLSSALHSKGRSYWTKFDGTQSNRMFSFCYFIAMHEIHRHLPGQRRQDGHLRHRRPLRPGQQGHPAPQRVRRV